jgi:PKD repeat protein
MRSWPVRAGAWAVVVALLLVVPIPNDLSHRGLGSPTRSIAGLGSIRPCPVSPACAAPRATPMNPVPSVSNTSTGWVQVIPTNNSSTPGDRTQPSFAYDPLLGQVVMYGGYNGNGNTALSDTWTFSGGVWTEITSTLNRSPPARWGGQMVWDPVDQLLVMFGGRSLTAFMNDTWTFNGTAWTNVTTSVAPQPRAHYTMAYDPVDRYILLSGGDVENILTSSWSLYNDTWSWSNGTWTNISSGVNGSIAPRVYAPSAYDPWNGSVVIVGGVPAEGCVVGSPVTTYRSNVAWSFPSFVGPPNVSQGMMVYDPLGPFLFTFAGELTQAAGCPQTNDTWVRTNGTWVNISASAGLPPAARYLSGMTYDAHDQEILLFGGNSIYGYMSDTWVYRIQPVRASIVAPRTVGSAPFTAAFSANASGGSEVFRYNWSFGDGNYSTLGPNVTHLYARLGAYNVVLNVTDVMVRSNLTNLTVHVIRTLTATTSASPTVGSVPLTVNFTVNAAGGLPPYNYSWNFGDGSGATGASPSHVYLSAGNFTAICMTRDLFGDSNRSTFLINVAPSLRVTVASSPTAGIVPFEANFSAAPAGGNPPYVYLWQFGDGGTASSPDANHTFTRVGTYTSSLTVTDRLGRTTGYSAQFHAFAPLSVSAQTNVSAGVAPLPVQLTAGASGGDGLENFSWNFGDGSAAVYGAVTEHVYASAGTYSVQLRGTDLGRNAFAELALVVVAPLAVHLTASVVTGETGAPVQFNASITGSTAPLAISWTFGDGAVASGGTTQVHIYARAGTYTARLSVADLFGERLNNSVLVGIARALSVGLLEQAPVAVLGTSDNLSAAVSGGIAPVGMTWSGLPLGCPTSATVNLRCTPEVVGNYTIGVVVTDRLGLHAYANISMAVISPQGPVSSSGSSGSALGLWIVAGVVLAAGAILLVVLIRRRGHKIPEPTELEEGAIPPPDDESPP